MEVNIYYIRHGISVANCVHYAKALGSIRHKFVPDPALTSLGVTNTITAGKFIKQKIQRPTIVCCSALYRAIETAYNMFPDEKIKPMPYICEVSYGLENQPQTIEIQKEKFSKQYPNNLVQWDYNKDHGGRTNSNFESFIKHLEEIVLPVHINKHNINVVVVTHGRFMHNNLNIMKPQHNSVYHKKYIYSDRKLRSMSEVNMICTGWQFTKKEQQSL
tara:strand:+ start:3619 stop:4269 length:651 start_codon:yes stop_codon:yes gene_type:complete